MQTEREAIRVRTSRPVLGVVILWVFLTVGFGIFTPGQALSSAVVTQLYLETLSLSTEFAELSRQITEDTPEDGKAPQKYVAPLIELLAKAYVLSNNIGGEIKRVNEDLRKSPRSTLHARELRELGLLYRVVFLTIKSIQAYLEAMKGEANASLWVEIANLSYFIASTAIDILAFSP